MYIIIYIYAHIKYHISYHVVQRMYTPTTPSFAKPHIVLPANGPHCLWCGSPHSLLVDVHPGVNGLLMMID